MNAHEKINYVEFPARDLAATKAFFSKVFDWSFIDYGPDYMAFANAGLPLAGIGWDDVMHPVTLGIGFGLLLGKQLGVLGFCWAAIRLGWAQRPSDMSWSALYGTAILSGIGFTMSLFIGSLAFESAGARAFDERLGILIGSLLSALMGYAVLRFIAFRHGRPLAALPSTPAEATNN